jgi:hypothetical protein
MKPEQPPQPPHERVKYFFFLDGHKIEVDSSSLSGSTVRAKLPSEKTGYAIYLEAHGNDADKLVNDSDNFSLEKNPLRFYSVPPATFGQE